MPAETSEGSLHLAERHLQAPSTVRYEARVNRWAIVVGISHYMNERLNLRYAHRDAEELYKLLQTPSGGGFEAERIVKLIDEEATTASITRALRSFLKKPAREDVVLLYFACHGAPDLDRPNIVYLITHDTDPEDISGTALPMREIDLSLKENLLAERVVIIADTCHSAVIGGGTGRRSAVPEAQAINAYLEEVSKAKGGVALLTSAEASETAQEGQDWGGGHGVFTYYLLEGLRGAADVSKDGFVSVGELFDYVRDRVKQATDNRQHPAIGTTPFDRSLPMGMTGDVDAQQYHRLGCLLHGLGWLLDDVRRFEAAGAQFNEALRLSRMAKTPLPEAELGLGKALMASGDIDGAVRVLSELSGSSSPNTSAEALLYLGVAHAKRRDEPAAAQTFKRFLEQTPNDENRAWVQARLQRTGKGGAGRGRKYALLIGINQYEMPKLSPLRGCVNDIRLVARALADRCGFDKADILSLEDRGATKRSILEAFRTLGAKATAGDTVIVHYSGHSVPESHRDVHGFELGEAYLIVHDTVDSVTGIPPVELHELMRAIPAEHKTLILDTHPSLRFIQLVEDEGDYALLLASDSAEMAYEHQFEMAGELVPAGLFTGALVQQIAASDPATLTYGMLIDSAIETIRALSFNQTPVLIGDREELVFAEQDAFLSLFDFAQRRNYSALNRERVSSRYSHLFKRANVPFSRAHYSFGRALLEHGDYVRAIEALETAQRQHPGDHSEATLSLAKAQIGGRRYAEAAATIRRYAGSAPEDSMVMTVVQQVEKLARGRRYALLVGIDDYVNAKVHPVRGAVNDAQLLREILSKHCAFRPEDMTLLCDAAATRDQILEAFRRLAHIGREEPALFYFAGNGSIDVDGAPTLVSADGRQGQIYDIGLQELAELAQDAANLVSILDAGWIRYRDEGYLEGLRTVAPDDREPPAKRDVSLSRTLDPDKLTIGALTVYGRQAVGRGFSSTPLILESLHNWHRRETPAIHGHLTFALAQTLDRAGCAELTFERWLADAARGMGTSDSLAVFGDRLAEGVFDNFALRDRVLSSVTKIEQEPIYELILMLRRFIDRHQEQGDPYPQGWLNLGIAYGAVREYDRAVEALERAIGYYGSRTVLAQEKERDPRTDDYYREAPYQLGRILLERGSDFSKAVSELNDAISLDPGNIRAYYYLGMAIQQMVEQETLGKAAEALETYLARGAPLGHEDEVRAFLGSRKNGSAVAAGGQEGEGSAGAAKQGPTA